MFVLGCRESDGTVKNCTTRALTGNQSTYRNDWVWLPESKDEGSTSFGYCSKSAETWELKVIKLLRTVHVHCCLVSVIGIIFGC